MTSVGIAIATKRPIRVGGVVAHLPVCEYNYELGPSDSDEVALIVLGGEGADKLHRRTIGSEVATLDMCSLLPLWIYRGQDRESSATGAI